LTKVLSFSVCQVSEDEVLGVKQSYPEGNKVELIRFITALQRVTEWQKKKSIMEWKERKGLVEAY
jgi:hypothetical protein